MQYAHTLGRGLARTAVFLFLTVLATGVAAGQDLILNGNVTNNGTISVNRNVVNNTAGAVAVSGTGVVKLIGTTAGSHSIDGGGDISFTNLDLTGSRVTTLDVNTTVVDALRVGDGTTAYTAAGNGFDIATFTLSLGGSATYQSTSSSALTFSGGVVDYTDATSQTILTRGSAGLSTTYGTLNLTGDADFTVPAGTGGSVSAATVSHTGAGDVTVNEDFNVTTTGAFGTLADVASGKTLDFQSTTAASSITNLTTLAGTVRKSGDQAFTLTTVTNTGASGFIENTGTNTLTIGTLTANAGTVRSTSTGTVAFTNAAASSGTITTATGTLDFNNNLSGTGTLSITGAGNAFFAGSLAQNSLDFNSASTVTYDGAAQAIATSNLVSDYGNLVSDGSAAKTAGATFNVNGDLTLNQNITQTAGDLTLAAATSDVGGAGEVIGSVRRTHNFTSATAYAFNRSNVQLTFGTTAAGDMAINMQPATSPTSPVTAKFVQRSYAFDGDVLPGNVTATKLYYDAGEFSGVTAEGRLGIRTYDNTDWSKLFFAGYTRTAAGGEVTHTTLNNSLAGVTELGLFQVTLIANTTGNWATAGTWDEGVTPTNDDDVEIMTAVTVAADVAGGDRPASAIVGTGGSLDLTSGSLAILGALNVNNDGFINSSATRTLSGTSWTNNTSGTSSLTGDASFSSLTNTAGTLNFTAGTISGAVSNAAAGVISVAGGLTLANGSVQTITSDGNITVTGASGNLTIGVSATASSLTMGGTSTLTIDNAAGQLNVFGNLTLGAATTLSNVGTITVGE